MPQPMTTQEDVLDPTRVAIAGHQMDVGDALREHAISQLGATAAKYFGAADDVAVTFSRTGKGFFGCTIRVHSGHNLYFEGEAEEAEAPAAFNQALERVAKQLRRRKRALREDKPINPTKEGLL